MVELRTPGLIESIIFLLYQFLPIISIIVIIIAVPVTILFSKSSSQHAKKIAGFSLIAIFSIVFTLFTLYLPKTINNANVQNTITCGWPLPFVEFDIWMNSPGGGTASCLNWIGSAMTIPKKFLWDPFILNVVIVFGVLGGGIYLIQKLYKGKKKKN